MWLGTRDNSASGITYHDLGYLALRYIGQCDLLYGYSLPRGPIEGT